MDMSKTGIGLIPIAALALLLPNLAQARCSSFDKEAKYLGEIAKGICGVAVTAATGAIAVSDCNQAIGTAAGISKKAVNWWNDLANNGPSKIGPRDLALGRHDHGKLVAPAGRLWIVDKPVAGKKKVTITHRDGKGGAMIDICMVNGNGKVTYLDYLEIPKKPKDGVSKKKTVTVKNGGWLLVDMRGQGGLGKSFSYDIKVANAN